jgi:hypothetical protein
MNTELKQNMINIFFSLVSIFEKSSLTDNAVQNTQPSVASQGYPRSFCNVQSHWHNIEETVIVFQFQARPTTMTTIITSLDLLSL